MISKPRRSSHTVMAIVLLFYFIFFFCNQQGKVADNVIGYTTDVQYAMIIFMVTVCQKLESKLLPLYNMIILVYYQSLVC
jgi:hypothetical protein